MAKRKTQGWQLGFNPQMKKGNAQRAIMFSPYRLRISRMFQRLKGPWMVKGQRQHTSSKWPKWTCKCDCISTICIIMAPAGTFFTFLLVAGNKGEKGSLAHLKTWFGIFGRHLCCLVHYANLHNLPCICITMAPAGTFFHFSSSCWKYSWKKEA